MRVCLQGCWLTLRRSRKSAASDIPPLPHPCTTRIFKINPEQAIAILKLLDKSSDITTEISEEINNDLSDVDKEAGESLKRKMRPPLNFKDMGIPVGDQLVFAKGDEPVYAEVADDRKVIYQGKEYSLTALTRELLGLDYNVQPTNYWLYNGKNLHEIYNETYIITE